MRFDSVQKIKESVTMREVLERYGFDVDRKGFVCCPFHNEKTPSMKIYGGDGGYHCFGCGEHGDVITFVQRFFGLTFREALSRIDADFSLGLFGNHSFEELRKSHYKRIAFQAKRDREKEERNKLDEEYWSSFDEWKRLDDNRRKYSPKSADETPHPLFMEALQKLESQTQALEMLSLRRRML